MRARPATKSIRGQRFNRCPKCQKLLRFHKKRCPTCHRVQPK